MSRSFMLTLFAVMSFAAATVCRADTVWKHNESTVVMRDNGGDVSIVYETPSSLMQRNGVTPGTVLFTGHRDGNFLFGRAHRFTARCAGTYDYDVAGQWYGSDQFILWGLAQRRGDGCSLGQPFTDQLSFDHVSTSVQVGSDASTKNLLDEKNSKVTETVLKCYRKGAYGGASISILQMRDCVGAWVTPKILLQCVIGAYCAVIGDTVADQEVLKSELEAAELDVGKPLILPRGPEALPPMPDRASIDLCRKSSQDQHAFEDCVVRKSSNGRYDALLTCVKSADDAQRTKCLLEAANNGNFTYLAGCGKGRVPTASELVDCIPNDGVKAMATTMSNCVSAAAQTNEQIACLSQGLPSADVAALSCVAVEKSSADMIGCLTAAKGSAQAAIANSVASCLIGKDHTALECAVGTVSGSGKALVECFALQGAEKLSCIGKESTNIGGNIAGRAACVSDADDDVQRAKCFGADAGPEFSRVAACALEKDETTAAICMLGDSKEARAVQHYYQCAKEGTGVADLVANCTDGLLDAKSGQALSCVVRADGDGGKLAACAAGAALPPNAAKLVACAASSQGATDFALCSAGPAMNAEWRIAAECAVNSGGEPISFASCTAGRLTIRELTKCFENADCFGRNNTIVAGVRNAIHDLTEGPGRNNEVVKALTALDEATGGENSVINNPGQILGGSNSMFRNPGQIWGGDSSVFNQVVGGNNSEARKIMRAFDPSTW